MKKIVAAVIALMMVLTLVPTFAFAERTQMLKEPGDLNDVLNVPGGTLEFVTEGDYVWVPDLTTYPGRTTAKTTNYNISNSTCTVTTTLDLVPGDVVSFDYFASCEIYNFDSLVFYVNDEFIVEDSAFSGWKNYKYDITEKGTYELKWAFEKDGSSDHYDDTCWLDNIAAGKPVAVTGVEAAETLTINTLRFARLDYTLMPATATNRGVTYTSSDESIVTVTEEGFVFGVAAGSATVTVTSDDGSFSDTCEVTVAQVHEPAIISGCRQLGNTSNIVDWVEFSEADISDVTSHGMAPNIHAAEYVDGMIYGYAQEEVDGVYKSRFVKTTGTFGSNNFTETLLDYNMFDISFNYTDGIMYGIGMLHRVKYLLMIDIASGNVEEVGPLTKDEMTFAIDSEGNAYSISYSGALYQIDLTTCEETYIGYTGHKAGYKESMTFDYTTDTLFWSQVASETDAKLYMVDKHTGDAYCMGEVEGRPTEMCGMFVVSDDLPDVPNTSVESVEVVPTEITVRELETGKLTAVVKPFSSQNKNVTWSSADETIATVDDEGVVTGVHYGTTTVTATTEDGGFTADCAVTIIPVVGSVYWGEYFETNPLDRGWKALDEDGDGYNWDWWGEELGAGIDAYEGTGAMWSASYVNEVGPLAPDNWLFSEPIEIPADSICTTISWYAKGQDPSYYDEYYGVYVGTSAEIEEMTQVFEGEAAAEYEQHLADISEYAGQTVYIAFRHYYSMDLFVLDLDMVEVYVNDGTTPTPTPTPSATPTPTPTATPTPTPTPEVNTFTVTFVDWDDTVLAEVEVNEGEDATAPADPEREGYLFAGWEGEFTNVTADLTIKATYGQMGDVTGDDLLNTGDAVIVLKYCVDMTTFDDFQRLLADFSGDGNVNTGDAVTILIYCVEQ